MMHALDPNSLTGTAHPSSQRMPTAPAASGQAAFAGHLDHALREKPADPGTGERASAAPLRTSAPKPENGDPEQGVLEFTEIGPVAGEDPKALAVALSDLRGGLPEDASEVEALETSARGEEAIEETATRAPQIVSAALAASDAEEVVDSRLRQSEAQAGRPVSSAPATGGGSEGSGAQRELGLEDTRNRVPLQGRTRDVEVDQTSDANRPVSERLAGEVGSVRTGSVQDPETTPVSDTRASETQPQAPRPARPEEAERAVAQDRTARSRIEGATPTEAGQPTNAEVSTAATDSGVANPVPRGPRDRSDPVAAQREAGPTAAARARADSALLATRVDRGAPLASVETDASLAPVTGSDPGLLEAARDAVRLESAPAAPRGTDAASTTRARSVAPDVAAFAESFDEGEPSATAVAGSASSTAVPEVFAVPGGAEQIAVQRGQAAAAARAPAPVAGPPEEAVPLHVEWLVARGGGTARLTLHPPSLGEVELTVRVRGSAVEVQVRANEPAAQQLVGAQRHALADALAVRDLRMDHFEVLPVRDDAATALRDGGQERGAAFGGRATSDGEDLEQRRAGEGRTTAGPLGNPGAVTNATTGAAHNAGASAVDLRV